MYDATSPSWVCCSICTPGRHETCAACVDGPDLWAAATADAWPEPDYPGGADALEAKVDRAAAGAARPDYRELCATEGPCVAVTLAEACDRCPWVRL